MLSKFVALGEDPLSATARDQRKNALLLAAVGLAVVKLGFLPTEISALGINLQEEDQDRLLFALLLASLYFVLSFAVYGFIDYVRWQSAREDAASVAREISTQQEILADELEEMLRHYDGGNDEQRAAMAERLSEHQKRVDETRREAAIGSTLLPLARARTGADFWVPLLFAAWAVAELINAGALDVFGNG